MCGIAGAGALDGRAPDADGVRAMTAALAHRGPDGEGLEVLGPAVLGHRRLAIIDLSRAGRQPMADASGRYTVVFNGEIYNYLELRSELEAAGVGFRSRSDTEVLLEACARWGHAAVERFNGMFAFAIWDVRERTLFLARDRFGEKPLFYRHRPGREFRFASEAKALVPPGSGAGRARPEVLFRFLAYGHAGTTAETFFEGVEQVPPGHTLTLTDGEIALRRYWALPEGTDGAAKGGPHHSSDETGSIEQLAALLEDAVRIRLRSDVPVGTSLSGGIDSSTVASLVARLRAKGEGGGAAQRQAGFSACFPGSPVDESRWIDVVAGAAGIESHRVVPTAEGFLEDFPRVVLAQEEPVGGPSIYAQWKVMELARSEGVTVLLDGQGADEVFAGYHFFYGDLWWSGLRAGRVGEVRRGMREFDAGHGKGAARRILMPALRSRAPRWLRAAKGGPSFPWLARDFVRAAARPLPPRPGDLRASLRESQGARMLPHLLRHADRNSMAFSREVRLPFLDHRVVEFVDALPDGMKLRGPVTKWVLRETIRGLVPEEVRARRDKIAFAVPFRSWMRGTLLPAVRETLGSRSFRERGVFDAAGVAGLLRRFEEGDEATADTLWHLFAAEHWMRAFCDGKAGGASPAPTKA